MNITYEIADCIAAKNLKAAKARLREYKRNPLATDARITRIISEICDKCDLLGFYRVISCEITAYDYEDIAYILGRCPLKGECPDERFGFMEIFVSLQLWDDEAPDYKPIVKTYKLNYENCV